MRRKLLIRPMALIFLLWMVLTDRSGAGVMTLLAAVLHEGGHILAAFFLRIRLRELRLDFLGARLNVTGRVISYGEEWLLCAAGPTVSLLASLAASPLWHTSGYAVIFSCASLILGLLNLLPIRTFDGGRMLECMLLARTTPTAAMRVMNLCTFLFLFLLWSLAVYFLLRANDGLSLFLFSSTLFSRFLEGRRT